MFEDHAQKNQHNYDEHALTHGDLGLHSSLYLAYRDIPQLLEAYVFPRLVNKKCRFLDFGCGAGLSTNHFTQALLRAGYEVDAHGVDINEENLKLARARVPSCSFHKIAPFAPPMLGEFDLIICNMVLLEHPKKDMIRILQTIYPMLSKNGVFITTNGTSEPYKSKYKWLTINGNFPENQLYTDCNGEQTLKEDQPVKLEVSHSGTPFSFFDFFHSERTYQQSFKETGFSLIKIHKPLGREQELPWKSEMIQAPYKIHVLCKTSPEPQLEQKAIFKTI